MTVQRCRWIALLASTLAAACARDAPEAIAAQRFEAPILVGGAAAIQVGLTDDGEGRARLALSGPILYRGAVGFRAHLRAADGTALRRPARRFSNEQSLLLLSGLDAGVSYSVQLVTVSNLGIESGPPTTTWDDDDEPATPEVPISIAVPSARTDATPPAVPCLSSAEWHGDAVSLNWSSGLEADLYGYRIERGTDASGPFTVLGPLVLDAANPHFRDAGAQPGQTYYYRLRAEDLSGNLSAASPPFSFAVP
ncbi:MAG: fibronectin type III domain-containing protein [Deltaproteobacteria bacterium]|nr:fibronectin type III domain-containing protein [Deltaproteobacteria bacterium]